MHIQKIKKKLDFLYVNKSLADKNCLMFEYKSKTSTCSLTNKHLNKHKIYSIKALDFFSYKFPVYLKKSNNYNGSEDLVFFKFKSFLFKNSKLFKKCSQNIFSNLNAFFSYFFLLFFLLVIRKNG